MIFRANCVTIRSKETFFISINSLFINGVKFYDICQTVLRTPSSQWVTGWGVSLGAKIITSLKILSSLSVFFSVILINLS